jgi:hypothetical protein
MLSIRTCAASLFTLAAAAAFPTAAEASLAQKLGTSYGGRLGGSTTTSTWQATGDPAWIQEGSMSTEYDPLVASLFDVKPGPAFDITVIVGVRSLNPNDPSGEVLVPLQRFYNGLPSSYVETGYLQVAFLRKEGNTEQSFIPFEEGYVQVDVEGTQGGDDTHAMFFRNISGDPDKEGSFRLYAENGTRPQRHPRLPHERGPLGRHRQGHWRGDARRPRSRARRGPACPCRRHAGARAAPAGAGGLTARQRRGSWAARVRPGVGGPRGPSRFGPRSAASVPPRFS